MNAENQLEQITELGKEMILSGTLLKNVKRHFMNLGMPEELSDKLCRLSEIKAEEFQNYKSK